MNDTIVDNLVLYCLALANEEDAGRRELGTIHLLKYLYLADLAQAESSAGGTLTGIPWTFHHYGPWSVDAHRRIDQVTSQYPVGQRSVPGEGRAKGDLVRFWVPDEDARRRAERHIPIAVRLRLKSWIHEFADDTAGLVGFVYRTPPMRHAAPGEQLDFSVVEGRPSGGAPLPAMSPDEAPLSVKERRRRREALQALGEEMRARLRSKRAQQTAVEPPPRYDDVFVEGVAWLDSLAGEPITPMSGLLTVDQSVWKSAARSEDDLP